VLYKVIMHLLVVEVQPISILFVLVFFLFTEDWIKKNWGVYEFFFLFVGSIIAVTVYLLKLHARVAILIQEVLINIRWRNFISLYGRCGFRYRITGDFTDPVEGLIVVSERNTAGRQVYFYARFPGGKRAFGNRVFDVARDFQEGMAAVKEKWSAGVDSAFHIYPDGRPAYKQRYGYVGDFRCRRAVAHLVDNNGTVWWFHIGPDGHPAYSELYLLVSDYSEGFARVQDTDRKWRYIKADGEPIFDKSYDGAEDFSGGEARVMIYSEDGQPNTMLINTQGKPVGSFE